MQNFDQLIERYIVKTVDENNSQVVKYEIKKAFKRTFINLLNPATIPISVKATTVGPKQKPKKSKRIMTPMGEFTSKSDAAIANDICVGTLNRYLKSDNGDFYFL